MRRYETFHHAQQMLPWQTKRIFIIVLLLLPGFFQPPLSGEAILRRVIAFLEEGLSLTSYDSSIK